MRRILIENARRKNRKKHGGEWRRMDLEDVRASSELSPEHLLMLNDAIEVLSKLDRHAADVAKLRCFAGFTVEEAAAALQLSRSNAYRHWTYAKAWLFNRLVESRHSTQD